MKKFYTIIIAAISLLALCGCDDEKTKLITFHIGNPRAMSYDMSRTDIKMPISGYAVSIANEQFMYSGDLKNIQVAQVTLPDGSKELGFLFSGDQRAALRLYQATAGNMGGYIVVKYDNKPIAMRKIDTVISDGVLFAVAELQKDEDIHKMVQEMNESLKEINEFKLSMD